MRGRRVDIRQVMAGILTLSMFGMLANMIKRDHFDYAEPSPSFQVKYPRGSPAEYHALIVTEKISGTKPSEANKRVMKEEEKRQVVKPCWKISAIKDMEHPKGHIVFSLTHGPEYHMSQVANAVFVAKYLGATLILPDIRGKKPHERRNFSEIYDDREFINSLKGVLEVTRDRPIGGKPRVVRVPNMASKEYIESHIKPLFKRRRTLKISTYFPSINTERLEEPKILDPTQCLAMFGILRLQPRVREVVDGVFRRLKEPGEGVKGNRIIVVDLREEICEVKFCDVKRVGEFLRKIGFGPETAVYLTCSRWFDGLDRFRELFPRTYTKELLIPQDQNQKFLGQKDSDLGKFIDFSMCSESDVYVPNDRDLFYTNVAGARIASGRTQILFPSESSGFPALDLIPPSISKKTHSAFSCLC